MNSFYYLKIITSKKKHIHEYEGQENTPNINTMMNLGYLRKTLSSYIKVHEKLQSSPATRAGPSPVSPTFIFLLNNIYR